MQCSFVIVFPFSELFWEQAWAKYEPNRATLLLLLELTRYLSYLFIYANGVPYHLFYSQLRNNLKSLFVYSSKKRYIEDFTKPKTEQYQAFSLLIPCRSIIFVVFLIVHFCSVSSRPLILYAVYERRQRKERTSFEAGINKLYSYTYLFFFPWNFENPVKKTWVILSICG